MNVYLVPAGGDLHELYCEESKPVPTDGAPRTGLWGRMVDGFTRALAEGEAERHRPVDEAHPDRGRLRRFITRKLAEAVAEQRLLWYLRKETSAVLLYPVGLSPDQALGIVRREFARDRDKHRRWCVIDALLSVASAPIALLPGPNVLAYYFLFRTVGHYLSMRGAQQGLSVVQWEPQASTELAALRDAYRLVGEARSARIDAIAAALGLERLATFVEGVAARYTPAS